MTIALVYRNGDEAFFLHDFRITHLNGKQIDAMMKFSIFDQRLGMFFAGDVAAFKRLIPRVHDVASKITIDNVLEPDGPLATAIESYMMGNPDDLPARREVEILGFFVDGEKKKNECFYVLAQVGQGSNLTKVSQKEVKVIGSARNLPGLSDGLTATATHVLGREYALETTLQIARNQLKAILGRAGSNSYSELGISPVFVGSVLDHADFKMIGERVSGERVTSDFGPDGGTAPVPHDYTFERKDGSLQLVDNITGKKIVIEEAEHYSERPGSELLDPERLTQGFDPSRFANSNGVIYVINQWVVDDKLVCRTIDKTNLLGKTVCDPDYIRLACDVTEVPNSVEHKRYMRSGDHGLFVRPSDQGAFEAGIQQHVFDHAWLSKHIRNYPEIYA